MGLSLKIAGVGAVVCTQAVAATRMESLQRSRMGSGQASVAGSMLLRAATMGPGQCLSAESFLGDGRACFSIQNQIGTTGHYSILEYPERKSCTNQVP